jgi:DNA (cytosine-5)-methyltransferase 1
MNELALFAGAGGGILGGKLLGWRTVAAVEVEPFARDVLLARQRDGIFDLFPVWDDVRTFDGHPWRGHVDVISGGFPCQDISVAGRGAGLDGDRSGLWSEMARIIGEVRPEYVFAENSSMLVVRGLERVLADLAALGFDVAWRVLSAADLGAPHLRERIWIVGRNPANANLRQRNAQDGAIRAGRDAADSACSPLADAEDTGQRPDCRRVPQPKKRNDAWRCGADEPCSFCGYPFDQESLGRYGCPNCEGEGFSDAVCDGPQGLVEESQQSSDGRPTGLHDRARGERVWQPWPPESGICRVVDGMAHRAHRIRAGGNGQVARVAAEAFAQLREALTR